jgi:hypothetical protein
MENLNPLLFQYFIEAPLFEKYMISWAMIKDKRINKKIAEKLELFIKLELMINNEYELFMKEWKRNQKLDYAFTGSGIEWEDWKKNGYPVPVPITKQSIRELKGYFARLDCTLLRDCVNHWFRDYDIFSEYPTKDKVEREKKPSILDEIQSNF